MQLTVYYDGACPLCLREIHFYRRLRGGDAIAWIDASDLTQDWSPVDLTRDAALARLHARTPDGRLLSGASAFRAIWAVLPAWRWLSGVLSVRGALPVAERFYRVFLKVRPALQWTLRGSKKRCDTSRCDA